MSERKASALIKDILNCIKRISTYTNSLSFETFSANYIVLEACLYNLQVIGEAVSKIPDNIKKTEPQIPWALIKGMRNRLIHEYFGTDIEIVWKVINEELPEMIKALEEIHTKLLGKSK